MNTECVKMYSYRKCPEESGWTRFRLDRLLRIFFCDQHQIFPENLGLTSFKKEKKNTGNSIIHVAGPHSFYCSLKDRTND